MGEGGVKEGIADTKGVGERKGENLHNYVSSFATMYNYLHDTSVTIFKEKILGTEESNSLYIQTHILYCMTHILYGN